MKKSRERRLDQFDKARARLRELIERFEGDPSDDGIRDGVVQRFEFTWDLAWKCAKDWLGEYEQDLQVSGPTSVLRGAVARNLIFNGNVWTELLEARNQTTHIYDEEQIKVIVDYVLEHALAEFDSLAERLRSFC